MSKLSRIIPISDLRQDAAKILKMVKRSNEPLVITQRGRAAAVMLSVEAYERAERDRELLRLLAKGEKEIEAGEGYDLDAALAEASLPEFTQEQVLPDLLDYLEKLEDEQVWDKLFKKTQPQLVAAARRAKREVAAGKAQPLGPGSL